jgi:hypothetical protein
MQFMDLNNQKLSSLKESDQLQAHLKAAQAIAQPKLLKELANRQRRDC